MSRTLLRFAAASGLMMSTALAQAPSPPSPASATPPAASSAQAGNPQVINAQSSDEWLASKLKGTSVIGSDNQKIGDVSDILFDKTGQVKAFIVNIGAILGLGGKEVALELTSFDEIKGTDGKADLLRVPMTKDQFNQAAEFKPLPKPAMTTGAAPAGTQRPVAPPADR